MITLKSCSIMFLSMFLLGIALVALTPLETEAGPGPPIPVRTACAVFPECAAYEGSLADILIYGTFDPDTVFVSCGCMN